MKKQKGMMISGWAKQTIINKTLDDNKKKGYIFSWWIASSKSTINKNKNAMPWINSDCTQ
jgi:hypothetical protein